MADEVVTLRLPRAQVTDLNDLAVEWGPQEGNRSGVIRALLTEALGDVVVVAKAEQRYREERRR